MNTPWGKNNIFTPGGQWYQEVPGSEQVWSGGQDGRGPVDQQDQLQGASGLEAVPL